MPITVTPDVIWGTRAHFSRMASSVPRVFLVEGLTPSLDIHMQAIAAVQASGNNAGMFQAHPTQVNLFVSDYDTEVVGNKQSPSQTKVYVTATYSTPEASTTSGYTLIEIASANGQSVINRWQSGPQKGQPILIGYDPTGNANQPDQINPTQAAADMASGVVFQTVRVPGASRNTIYRFTRLESGPPLVQQAYRQSVNQSAWNGLPAGSVMCRSVDGQNLVGGGIVAPSMYRVVYELEHNPDFGGWTRVEFFRDEHYGKPIVGVDITDGTNNGYTFITPPSMDFGGLNLPSFTGSVNTFNGAPLINSGGQ